MVENSLWEGVPAFLREFNEQLEKSLGYQLPVEAVPVRFTARMGGDRDGNPNVTAEVTRRALLLSRWKAAELFLRDVQVLVSELSMTVCTPELRALAGEHTQEPYREVLKRLRQQLNNTLTYLDARLRGERLPRPADLLVSNDQLWQPLHTCYRSLKACGMGIIANGQLLDTLRRVHCFGVPLVRIDIRQKAPAIPRRWPS